MCKMCVCVCIETCVKQVYILCVKCVCVYREKCEKQVGIGPGCATNET
jgi:hypothetical protein